MIQEFFNGKAGVEPPKRCRICCKQDASSMMFSCFTLNFSRFPSFRVVLGPLGLFFSSTGVELRQNRCYPECMWLSAAIIVQISYKWTSQ